MSRKSRMSRSISERLLDCIGQIESLYIEEAESAITVSAASTTSARKSAKRKRIVKYSAYGVVGAAVTVGVIAGFLKLRSNRVKKVS